MARDLYRQLSTAWIGRWQRQSQQWQHRLPNTGIHGPNRAAVHKLETSSAILSMTEAAYGIAGSGRAAARSRKYSCHVDVDRTILMWTCRYITLHACPCCTHAAALRRSPGRVLERHAASRAPLSLAVHVQPAGTSIFVSSAHTAEQSYAVPQLVTLRVHNCHIYQSAN